MERLPFDHFVITRFSATFFDGQEPAEEDWLFYRLGFFYDALVPSVAGQVGAGEFTWFVYFDDRCSAEFRAAVEEMAAGVFVPIWTHVPFGRHLPQLIGERCTDAEWLLTTRIDSDDAVAKDYFAAVQQQFEPVDALTISFPRGLQMDRSGAIYQYDEPTGPFQSYVERRVPERSVQTVFGNPLHAQARRHGPLREVIAEPMWLQVIHGSNIANGVRGLRVRPNVLNERFTITLPYRRDIDAATFAKEWGISAARRVAYWATTPYYAVEWLDAKCDRMRGTHTKAQDSSAEGPELVTAGFAAGRRLKGFAYDHGWASRVESKKRAEQKRLEKLIKRGAVADPATRETAAHKTTGHGAP